MEEATLSRNELRDLFTLHADMPSHLHYKLMLAEKQGAMEVRAASRDERPPARRERTGRV